MFSHKKQQTESAKTEPLTQKLTVKNDAADEIKVKIYIRSLGAQTGSEEFLNQLELRVAVPKSNDMGYMFDAVASETAPVKSDSEAKDGSLVLSGVIAVLLICGFAAVLILKKCNI